MSFNVMEQVRLVLQKHIGVTVSASVPAKRPKEFITFERTGGGFEHGRDEVNLAIQCWAETNANAYELALTTRLVLVNLRELISEVCSSRVESIYNFPDPDSRAARMQLDVYLITRP